MLSFKDSILLNMRIEDPSKKLKSSESQKSLIPETIDISGGWDKVSFWEIIKSRLQTLGIPDTQILVSGCGLGMLGRLQTTGSYSEKEGLIWGSTVREIENDSRIDDQNALDYALDNMEPVLAIYDLSKLRQNSYKGGTYGYEPGENRSFKDALIKIFILK